MEILFWFTSLIFFIFFYESIFISFRCNFCTWVHIAYDLLLSCLLVSFFSFFLRKSWRFVLTKMEMFWFSLFIFSLFLYIFYEIIFISFRCSFSKWVNLACGLLFSFLLVFFFFFFKKVLLICSNLLYVVMFLFLVNIYVVMLKLLCCY